MPELETKVELLKQELHDQRKIHDRLDIAIEKLTDVSNSIHRMLAVHEEKIARQEEIQQKKLAISEMETQLSSSFQKVVDSEKNTNDSIFNSIESPFI